MRSPPRGRLFALFAALPLGLGLAELVVRALDVRPLPLPKRQGSVLHDVGDELLLFENQPGAVERTTYADDPPHTVEMRVNAQGFRGPEVALEKPAGVWRIACVGDSHTFGDGVEEDGTWPAHLQRKLAARATGRPLEVVNCGVNGYDTLQEVLWMEQRVLALAPDVVILQYYVNDTAARRMPKTGEEPRDVVLELTSPRRGGFAGWVRAHSRLADLVADGVWRRRGLAEYARLRLELYGERSPGWLRVQDALRRARDELEARGIRFVVALYPFLVREGEHLSSHEAFERVRAFCAAEHIACIDAEPAFDNVPDLAHLRVSSQDYHGNSQAHERFAGAVEEWLARASWLGER